MKNKTKNPMTITLTVIAFVIIATILMVSMINYYYTPGQRKSMMINEELNFFKTIISTINSFLLIYLIYNYATIYSELKSNFSLGLIAMASALFAQSLTANPLLTQIFGFRGAGLGPFTIIPSIFTLIATIILIYLLKE